MPARSATALRLAPASIRRSRSGPRAGCEASLLVVQRPIADAFDFAEGMLHGSRKHNDASLAIYRPPWAARDQSRDEGSSMASLATARGLAAHARVGTRAN